MNRMQDRVARLGQVLQVFGQAPLAFYLAHLWLYPLVGAAAFRDGAGYPTVYLIWIASWWPLYLVTRRYRDFKQTKAADSYWRMF